MNLYLDKINDSASADFDMLNFKEQCFDFLLEEAYDTEESSKQVALENLESIILGLEALSADEQNTVIKFLSKQDQEFGELSSGSFETLKNKLVFYKNNSDVVSNEVLLTLIGPILYSALIIYRQRLSRVNKIIENRSKQVDNIQYQLSGSSSKTILPYKPMYDILGALEKYVGIIKNVIEKPSEKNIEQLKNVFYANNGKELANRTALGENTEALLIFKAFISVGLGSVISTFGVIGLCIIMYYVGMPFKLLTIVGRITRGLLWMATSVGIMKALNTTDSAATKGYTAKNVNELCDRYLKLSKELISISESKEQISSISKDDIKLCKKAISSYGHAVRVYGIVLVRILAKAKATNAPADE